MGDTGKMAVYTFCLLAVCASLAACSPSYRDISNPNGRRAVLDEANNDLTAGQCDNALDVLAPLYNSQYNDNDVRMLYSSAYACKGGLNLMGTIAALSNIQGSDIWSPLVKANYSANRNDGHLTSLRTASDILRQTATPAGSFQAADRPVDANFYMIFVQANVISSVISTLGAADPKTGNKTVALCAGCTVSDQCLVEVAIATINDSLNHVTINGSMSKVTGSVSAICSALGGACPTNKDFSSCGAPEAAQGQ